MGAIEDRRCDSVRWCRKPLESYLYGGHAAPRAPASG
ncbi:hypothetical protein J2129_001903 [Methanofollis sp. W23]|nr:hypothetical protein [Methanofollis sp. W23]